MNQVLEAIDQAADSRAKWRPLNPADERLARNHSGLAADLRRAFINGYAAERLRRNMSLPSFGGLGDKR